MRNILFLCISCSWFITMYSQSYRGVDLRPPQPKKGLKKIQTFLFPGTSTTDATLTLTRYYNSQGLLVKEIGFQDDFNENITWTRITKYPTPYERIETYTDNKGHHETGQFFYSKSGLIIKEIQSIADAPHNVIEYLYDEKDRLIREKDCDDKGCVIDTIIYLNDQTQLAMRRKGSEPIFDSVIYTFDTKGCQLTMDAYRPGGDVYNTGRCECNSAGKPLLNQWIYYRFSKGHYTQHDYVKDSTLYQYHSNGQLQYQEQWEYDRKELKLLITTQYNELGDPVLHTYNYYGAIIYREKMVYSYQGKGRKE